MKKYFIGLSLLIATAINAQKTSEKVVVDSKGEVVGRYIKETSTKFQVLVQDNIWVPKKGHKVMLYSASKGQGVIFPKNNGTVNVRKNPSINAPIVAQITFPEGEIPETAECLGFSNGWFKVVSNGVVGYVKSDNVEWNSIDTF